MMNKYKIHQKWGLLSILSAITAVSCVSTSWAQPNLCSDSPLSLQLLGSGGPISDDARASSGAVVWIDGKARLLLDAGGGTYLRYGEAGARLEDLSFIGISHFHTDHVADLPAILKGAYFLRKAHSVTLAGPTGDQNFPSMREFFNREFLKNTGAFAYLSGLSNASDSIQLAVESLDIDSKSDQPQRVWEGNGVRITALGIPHGDVPTLAYRIESARGTIVYSADQNGSKAAFRSFAQGADILVMPAAIGSDASATSRFMHAPPEIVGEIAAAIDPKLLILDHFMGRSLREKGKIVKTISQYYHGPIYAGRDLSCFPMPDKIEGK